MGEAKRRKQLDPNWGKRRTSSLDGNFIYAINREATGFSIKVTSADGNDRLAEQQAAVLLNRFLDSIAEMGGTLTIPVGRVTND